MILKLQGTSIIGQTRGCTNTLEGNAVNPADGSELPTQYYAPSSEEVERALQLAGEAFPIYSALAPSTRAEFLRAIADTIESRVEDIVERGPLETGLPEMRMRGESARTMGQLRMFADLIEEGSWVDARIEHAIPDRTPLPKPDLRSMLRPMGPVGVFCASNFPLAFSVAGGDTASALAAGCPVVVRSHSSHRGLAEIVGTCIMEASKKTGMPEGVFSLLFGKRDVGMAIVEHPVIKAVGFTGSRSGGTALMDAAAKRPEPIPVYAEMSSINPVVMLPGALKERGESLAEGFLDSLTLGVGQFCTNPGLVFIPDGHGDAFIQKLCELAKDAPAGVMLNAGICDSYSDSTSQIENANGVQLLVRASSDGAGNKAVPVVYSTTVKHLVENKVLHGEMFGPAAIIVRGGLEEIEAAIPTLEGQLTATLHGTDEELLKHASLVSVMEKRAGRIIFNGFPTGVEVCHAMVHGGPYPATADGRSTSVGTMAINRFCRPVSWQGFPQGSLPEELRDDNPRGIWRLVDGQRTNS